MLFIEDMVLGVKDMFQSKLTSLNWGKEVGPASFNDTDLVGVHTLEGFGGVQTGYAIRKSSSIAN